VGDFPGGTDLAALGAGLWLFTKSYPTPLPVAQLTVTTAAGASVWNSGQVAGNGTTNVPYGGPALKPDSDFVWAVTWWDGGGVASTPASAQFSTGLVGPGDWQVSRQSPLPSTPLVGGAPRSVATAFLHGANGVEVWPGVRAFWAGLRKGHPPGPTR
jgi:hypothetical protein